MFISKTYSSHSDNVEMWLLDLLRSKRGNLLGEWIHRPSRVQWPKRLDRERLDQPAWRTGHTMVSPWSTSSDRLPVPSSSWAWNLYWSCWYACWGVRRWAPRGPCSCPSYRSSHTSLRQSSRRGWTTRPLRRRSRWWLLTATRLPTKAIRAAGTRRSVPSPMRGSRLCRNPVQLCSPSVIDWVKMVSYHLLHFLKPKWSESAFLIVLHDLSNDFLHKFKSNTLRLI